MEFLRWGWGPGRGTRGHIFPLRSHEVTYFRFYFCEVKREDRDLNEVIKTFLRYHEVILFIQNWCKVIKMSDKVTRGHARSGEIAKGHTKLNNKMFGEEVKIIYIRGENVPHI